MSLNFANKITIVRILLVPLFITSLLYYSPERDYLRMVALGLFLIAAVSDFFDGYVARSLHQKTPAGAILDPLADKLLLISSFLCLFVIGHDLPVMRFPIWLVVAVISREVTLVIGSTILYLFNGRLGIQVSIWGKATTLFQMLCVLGILLQWELSRVFWYSAFILTVISGMDYARQGIRVLNNVDQQPSNAMRE